MLPPLDLAIIGIYMASMLALGLFLGNKEDSDGFFINGRKTKTALLIFTALSTSIGAGTVIGVAGEFTKTGISYGLSFALASFISWLFISWIAPRIKEWGDKIKAYTFGDFLAARYSIRTRRLGSIVVLVAYFTITSVQFVAFASLASIIGGFSFTLALFISALITIAYTFFAGIKGDIYTDAIQFFVMFPVFIALFIIGFGKTDLSIIATEIPAEFFSPFNYSGPVFFFGALVFGFTILLVSMEIWQRIFSAQDAKIARRAFF